MTVFIAERIALWGGMSLFVDGNSKITRENGSFEAPVPNAFSLPHISTCPGSTEICRSSCYVHGLEKNAPDLAAEYKVNAATLHRLLMSDQSARRSAEIFGDWISASAPRGFRWHVSGDVMHRRHAEWIVEVCRNAARVPCWIYTRTFEEVRTLLQARNLVVNLSADSRNWFRAAAVWDDEKPLAGDRLRLTYLTKTGAFPQNPALDVVFPDYELRGRALPDPTKHAWWRSLTVEQQRKVCPADFFGQSKAHRCGPCKKCL